MKKFVILFISVLWIGSIWGQTNNTVSTGGGSASSAPVRVIMLGTDTLSNIPTVSSPPVLEISELTFTGVENEGFISSGEKGYLRFTIRNAGQGDAYNLRLYTSETNGLAGLVYDNHKFIAQQFKSGETRTDSIYIEGRNNLRDGRAIFELTLREANGHQSLAAETSLLARELSKPNVDILNYDIYMLNDRELALQMTVKNTGSSNLNDVKISINYPRTVYVKGEHIKILSMLRPDESIELAFTFAKNHNFNETARSVFQAIIEDSNGRKLSQQTDISWVRTVDERRPGEIMVRSDVSLNIPISTNPTKNIHTYVLIIGNEKYSRMQNVPYAESDARIFGNYCVKAFNIPNENITLLTNATGNQMKEGLRELARKALYDAKGEAELIIYYSGHGVIAKDRDKLAADDEFDQYLIPVDVSGADASLSISRKDIYNILNGISFKRASLFLDACNIPGDRAIVKRAKYEWKGNVFVFASSSPEQTSVTYHEKGHGLFTYFLLKSIQDKKGKIDYNELTDQVIRNVERQSNNMADKIQTPEVNVSPQTGDSWKSWRLPE